jgi:hypothetical protein
MTAKMDFHKRKILVFVITGFVIGIAFFILIDSILFKKSPVNWCRVQFPEILCEDDTRTFSLSYKNIESPVMMSLDIHGISNDGSYVGFLQNCMRKQISSKAGAHTMSLNTVGMKHISSIIAVIYYRKDQSGDGFLHAAISDPIPLSRCKKKEIISHTVESNMFDIPMKSVEAGGSLEYRNTIIKKIIIMLYVSAVILTLYNAFLRTLKSAAANRFDLYFRRGLPVFLIFIGLFSFPDIRSLVTYMGRDIAKSGGWYNGRSIFQIIASALIIALSSGLIGLFFIHAKGKHWTYKVSFMGTVILAIITMLRLLSYHNLDVLLTHEIAGIRVWLLVYTLGIFSIITGIYFNIIYRRRFS